MMKKMEKLSKIKEFYDVIENEEKVVIYWYTKWCPDCFVIKPFLPKLERDFPAFKFYSINRDLDIDLARHYEIYGIPSFTVFKDANEVGRLVNKRRKSYKEVKTFLDSVTK
ncbi:thioredoxin family protein [Candidatus Izimaplasma bacterium]|nr:thioredoxin family protein [Candidatus Izimaplasma bacterium]